MTAVSEEALVEKEEVVTGGSLAVRLPFSFAKRYGLLVDASGEQLKVLHKDGLNAQALMEVQRHLSQPYQLEAIPDDDFDRRLGLIEKRFQVAQKC